MGYGRMLREDRSLYLLSDPVAAMLASLAAPGSVEFRGRRGTVWARAVER